VNPIQNHDTSTTHCNPPHHPTAAVQANRLQSFLPIHWSLPLVQSCVRPLGLWLCATRWISINETRNAVPFNFPHQATPLPHYLTPSCCSTLADLATTIDTSPWSLFVEKPLACGLMQISSLCFKSRLLSFTCC
jgi:hypothetical protein